MATGYPVKKIEKIIKIARSENVRMLQVADIKVVFGNSAGPLVAEPRPMPQSMADEIEAEFEAEEALLDASEKKKRRHERLMYYST
jgi:hypothetical protein